MSESSCQPTSSDNCGHACAPCSSYFIASHEGAESCRTKVTCQSGRSDEQTFLAHAFSILDKSLVSVGRIEDHVRAGMIHGASPTSPSLGAAQPPTEFVCITDNGTCDPRSCHPNASTRNRVSACKAEVCSPIESEMATVVLSLNQVADMFGFSLESCVRRYSGTSTDKIRTEGCICEHFRDREWRTTYGSGASFALDSTHLLHVEVPQQELNELSTYALQRGAGQTAKVSQVEVDVVVTEHQICMIGGPRKNDPVLFGAVECTVCRCSSMDLTMASLTPTDVSPTLHQICWISTGDPAAPRGPLRELPTTDGSVVPTSAVLSQIVDVPSEAEKSSGLASVTASLMGPGRALEWGSVPNAGELVSEEVQCQESRPDNSLAASYNQSIYSSQPATVLSHSFVCSGCSADEIAVSLSDNGTTHIEEKRYSFCEGADFYVSHVDCCPPPLLHSLTGSPHTHTGTDEMSGTLERCYSISNSDDASKFSCTSAEVPDCSLYDLHAGLRDVTMPVAHVEAAAGCPNISPPQTHSPVSSPPRGIAAVSVSVECVRERVLLQRPVAPARRATAAHRARCRVSMIPDIFLVPEMVVPVPPGDDMVTQESEDPPCLYPVRGSLPSEECPIDQLAIESDSNSYPLVFATGDSSPLTPVHLLLCVPPDVVASCHHSEGRSGHISNVKDGSNNGSIKKFSERVAVEHESPYCCVATPTIAAQELAVYVSHTPRRCSYGTRSSKVSADELSALPLPDVPSSTPNHAAVEAYLSTCCPVAQGSCERGEPDPTASSCSYGSTSDSFGLCTADPGGPSALPSSLGGLAESILPPQSMCHIPYSYYHAHRLNCLWRGATPVFFDRKGTPSPGPKEPIERTSSHGSAGAPITRSSFFPHATPDTSEWRTPSSQRWAMSLTVALTREHLHGTRHTCGLPHMFP